MFGDNLSFLLFILPIFLRASALAGRIELSRARPMDERNSYRSKTWNDNG